MGMGDGPAPALWTASPQNLSVSFESRVKCESGGLTFDHRRKEL
jgi:hypothetical protein